MGITSNFANVATVTRASTKTDAGGWDFTSGGTVGTLTEYASGVAAIHPTAGLLVEEGTTNEIRNPRFEGATVGTLGSGGALPTNFAEVRGGMTWSVDAVGTESGMDYLEISLSGTATGDAVLYFEASNQIAAVTGEDWTLSLGIKVVSGTLPGNFLFWIRGLTSGGSTSDDLGTQDPDPTSLLDGSIRRFHVTKTLNNNLGTTAYVRPAIYIDNPSGAVSCTFRIYATQCEEKAYPTSPVLPVVSSPAAATRAADSVVVNTGAWSSSTREFTLYIDAQLAAARAFYYYASVTDGTASNYYGVTTTGAVNRAVLISSGVQQVALSVGTTTVGDRIRLASSLADNNVVISSTGEAQQTDTSATIPDFDRIVLTGTGAGAAVMPGVYFKEIRYWPKNLTPAELEALVGN